MEKYEYIFINDKNIDTELENPYELWKKRICIAITTILITMVFFGMIIVNWLPDYLAEQYAKEKLNIKTGCLYQINTGIRNNVAFKIEDATLYTYYIQIPNTKNKELPHLEPNKCFTVQYIEVDLIIYKKNYVYNF
ncbi:hypothetical protein [Alysiella filiformis]|uniref:Uncharacterized protein n=1 Tax=Alysiella filiformis DSM 16848 TaxID=1120981 RepID=A0A286E6A2_9NEIS|nr:hypothetical protein [Alysiella filiformis]QMT31479.1 hypothetical protein H3L97_00760 [Alysiella filiformis]UBQ55510.1 hypothetical protein JF568_07915 [Alysiella filiformis DSM 16848]SOD66445.1 hypothetical protein SAMN02746062_00609 [Alysiella filiformis DSM 16848]